MYTTSGDLVAGPFDNRTGLAGETPWEQAAIHNDQLEQQCEATQAAVAEGVINAGAAQFAMHMAMNPRTLLKNVDFTKPLQGYIELREPDDGK